MKVQIKKLRDNAVIPEYQTQHAAAMDLHAAIDAPIALDSLDRYVVSTGLAISLPEGYEAQVRARSGLAAKHGLSVANGVGTIDADYRGELGVIVVNMSKEPFTIEPGMRIAQLIIARYVRADWDEVQELDGTSRGAGGFGSTGM